MGRGSSAVAENILYGRVSGRLQSPTDPFDPKDWQKREHLWMGLNPRSIATDTGFFEEYDGQWCGTSSWVAKKSHLPEQIRPYLDTRAGKQYYDPDEELSKEVERFFSKIKDDDYDWHKEKMTPIEFITYDSPYEDPLADEYEWMQLKHPSRKKGWERIAPQLEIQAVEAMTTEHGHWMYSNRAATLYYFAESDGQLLGMVSVLKTS